MREENLPGVLSVGAPIRDAGGSVVAAVSIAYARSLDAALSLEAMTPHVVEAAERISRGLGWRRRRSVSMLLNRDRLEDMLSRHGLDAVIATSPENVTYTSGYWALSQWIRRGPQTYVLLPVETRAEPVIIASTTLLDLLADQDVWISTSAPVRLLPGRSRRRRDVG